MCHVIALSYTSYIRYHVLVLFLFVAASYNGAGLPIQRCSLALHLWLSHYSDYPRLYYCSCCFADVTPLPNTFIFVLPPSCAVLNLPPPLTRHTTVCSPFPPSKTYALNFIPHKLLRCIIGRHLERYLSNVLIPACSSALFV